MLGENGVSKIIVDMADKKCYSFRAEIYVMRVRGLIMYEDYTRQSLPSRNYRELLGSALCVFNSNNAFIIENILRLDTHSIYDWYELIDKTSGELSQPIKETITKVAGTEISRMFVSLVTLRNRIVHSFQCTSEGGDQILVTKDKKHKQYDITEDFLLDFIKQNEQLSSKLHDLRGD